MRRMWILPAGWSSDDPCKATHPTDTPMGPSSTNTFWRGHQILLATFTIITHGMASPPTNRHLCLTIWWLMKTGMWLATIRSLTEWLARSLLSSRYPGWRCPRCSSAGWCCHPCSPGPCINRQECPCSFKAKSLIRKSFLALICMFMHGSETIYPDIFGHPLSFPLVALWGSLK